MPFDTALAAQLSTPWKLRLWMIHHLPMGWINGMYIEQLDAGQCVVVLKDRWWIRNPFGSVFWAVMGMAAELSTGVLIHVYANQAGVRFILVGMQAEFYKKVKGKSYYFCLSGAQIAEQIEALQHSEHSITLALPVIARDNNGEPLAGFTFQWQLRRPNL